MAGGMQRTMPSDKSVMALRSFSCKMSCEIYMVSSDETSIKSLPSEATLLIMIDTEIVFQTTYYLPSSNPK